MSRLNHINVALFGYDMGGGLALAFCKRLLQETCSGGRYEGTTVRIRFMGLFDCVTNRYEDNWLTGFMPMSNAVSSELLLPDEVGRCVHYAAAHELRFYKPLTIIGADPEDFRGKRQEQLFPGSQEDVGGGVEAGEGGVSDQLARYPLQMMYNRAYGAGVPMPSLSELKNVDPKLYVELQPSKDAENFQQAYRHAVKSLVTVTRVIEPSLMRLQSLSCTMPALTGASNADPGCYVPPQPLKITELPSDVETQYKGHIAIYIQWLRMWYDQNAQAAGKREGMFGLGAPIDPRAHARYEKLADELAYVERNALRARVRHGASQRPVGRQGAAEPVLHRSAGTGAVLDMEQPRSAASGSGGAVFRLPRARARQHGRKRFGECLWYLRDGQALFQPAAYAAPGDQAGPRFP